MVVLLPPGSSQPPPVSLPVTLLGNNAGVRNLGNYFCYRDSKGFLWMSSYAGLHRFDGKQLRIYSQIIGDSTSIKGSDIYSFFAEDNNTDIWFGSDQALHRYRRATDDFQRYNLTGTDVGEYRLLGIDASGKVWCTFDRRIYMFDRNTGFRELARIELRDTLESEVLMSEMQQDSTGQVIRVFSYGSYQNDAGLEIHSFEGDVLIGHQILFDRDAQPTLRIHDVFVLDRRTLLMASLSGLYHLDLITGRVDKSRSVAERTDAGCAGMGRFSDTTLLLAMSAGVYLEYRPDDSSVVETYVLYDQNKAIADPPTRVHTDRQGGVYVHIENQGLAYFHPGNLLFKHRVYNPPRGYEFQTTGFWGSLQEVFNRHVLATTRVNGVFLFAPDGTLLEIYSTQGPPPFQLPSDSMNYAMKDHQDRIWLFHYGRFISRFEDQSLSTLSTYRMRQMLWGGIQLSSGRFVFFPRAGLLKQAVEMSDSMQFSVVHTVNPTGHYGVPIEHNGKLYIGERNKALILLDTSALQIIQRIPFEFLISYLHFLPDSDDFLMASSGGLYRYFQETDSLYHLEYCTCDEAPLHGIFRLETQRYLIVSEKNLCTVDLEHETSELFERQHGAGPSKFARRTSLVHSDGRIWLGTDDVITTIDPGHVYLPRFHDQVNITSASIDNATLTDSICAEELQDLRLSYKTNTVSFEYAALSYAGINKHNYEYRMQGLEDDWIDNQDRGFARYAGLPPGDYVFEARVKDQPDSVRSVVISILPPLWMRTWFQVILGLLITGMVLLLVRNHNRRKARLQQLEFDRRLGLERERVRIATDMHDDVGSGLSALSMRAQVLARQADGEMKSQLEKLAANSRALTHKIREIIWTVNAHNDTLDNLLTTLQQYAEEYFEHSPVLCNVTIPLLQSDIPVDG
ncbi:MAG: triple tyrosine motif-containing protein, partial [Saprospiraceae bacterium]|nr:triple tyrosine motif-containing protein [Saprospiraceae bacterium]